MQLTTLLPTLALLASTALAEPAPHVKRLGINCRGSGVCPLATFENKMPVNVAQGLRDAIYSSKKPESTTFNDGDHIICVSSTLKVTIDASVDAGAKGAGGSVGLSTNGQIGSGGICAFMQNTKGQTKLGDIKKLADKILEHSCSTCGSVPVTALQGGNDPNKGILTFNYVKAPFCTGNCLADQIGS